MRLFTPDHVIYPAGGSRHDICIAGSIPDEEEPEIAELRNVTITNKELAARYRTVHAAFAEAKKLADDAYQQEIDALVVRRTAVENAHQAAHVEAGNVFKSALVPLDEEATARALIKYMEENAPRVAAEEVEA